MFADDVAEVRAMELANTEATEAVAPLHPREMQEDAPPHQCPLSSYGMLP